MRRVEIVVVGAGVMGTAAARALARAGREVVLLEQFQVGHTRGSSHGRSRIFRLSYDDPLYVRMAQQALPLWRELEAESGQTILRSTGGLDLGVGIEDHAAALAACGVAFERLGAPEARARFPSFLPSPGERLLYQGDSGFLAADRAWRALVDSAVAAGCDLQECAAVERLRVSGDRVEVVATDDTYLAGVAVVTAGAWVGALVGGAGIEPAVTPTRETVCYFRLHDGGPIPVVAEWLAAAPAVYSLPSPGQGIKAGEHHAGPVADPDEEGVVSEASTARIGAWVQERFPTAGPLPDSCETCLYTNTADESFVLERRGPVVVGSPCSGHGFKFAPLIGERLAGLATDPWS